MTYEEGFGGHKLAKRYVGAVHSGQGEQVWFMQEQQHQDGWSEMNWEEATADKISRTSSMMFELITEESVRWTTRKAHGANNKHGYLHLTLSQKLYT